MLKKFQVRWLLIGALIAFPFLFGAMFLDGITINNIAYYATPAAQLLWSALFIISIAIPIIFAAVLMINYLNATPKKREDDPKLAPVPKEVKIDKPKGDTASRVGAEDETDVATVDQAATEPKTETAVAELAVAEAKTEVDAFSHVSTESSGRVIVNAVVGVIIVLISMALIGVSAVVILFAGYREGHWESVNGNYVFQEVSWFNRDPVATYTYRSLFIMTKTTNSPISTDEIVNYAVEAGKPTTLVFMKPAATFEPPPPHQDPAQAANTDKQLPSATDAQAQLNNVGVQTDDIMPYAPYALVEINTAGPSHLQVFAQYYNKKWVVLSVVPFMQKCHPGGFSFIEGLSPEEVAQQQGGDNKPPNGVYPKAITLMCEGGDSSFYLKSTDGGYTWSKD